MQAENVAKIFSGIKGNIGKGKVIEAVDLGKVAFGFGYIKE